MNSDISAERDVERRLRAAQESFRQLVERSPFGIFTVDAEFRILQVSAGAQKTFENVRPLVGRDLAEVLRIVWPEPFASETIAIFRHVLETGEAYHAPSTVENRLDIAAAEAYDWKAEYMILPDGLPGVVCHFYDLSERLRFEESLRASEERLLRVYRQSPAGIVETDASGRMMMVNARWCEMLGYTEAELLQMSVMDVTHERSREVTLQAIGKLAAGGTDFLIQKSYRSKNGTTVEAHSSASALRSPDGTFLGLVAVVLDVTERNRAEEKLRASEAEFRAVFELSPVGKAQLDTTTGRFIRVNEKFCELTGYLAEELLGMSPTDLDFPEDRDPDSKIIGQMLRGEITSYVVEKRYVRKDGQIIWVQVSATLLHKAGGHPERTMAVIQDITERKQSEAALFVRTKELHESVERYRAATVAVSDLIWTNNAEGLMEGEQRGWGNFTGQTIEEYQGYGWSMAIHPEDAQPTIDAWMRAVEEKRTFVFEHRVLRHDGEWRDCSIRAVPIISADGSIREWVGVHTDITEQKRSEAQLRQLAADLSEVDRQKDEFLATLAHELRNPLAPIRSGLDLLKLRGAPDAIVEEVHLMMERQLMQTVRLVDDLMDVSRISRGNIELRKEEIPLSEVLSSSLETSRPLIEQMGHELTVTIPEQPIIVNADMVRLAQVFLNLLNNAAKYSDGCGHIHLNVESHGSEVVVSVKDSGIGIAADQFRRIFDMFTQVDRSLEKSQNGLGIGLTLVKRLVEMHGGEVEARSEGLGMGSEFIVRLPVVIRATEQQALVKENEQLAVSSLRILVVDDNLDLAYVLSLLLKSLGNEVRSAYDGQTGVDLAEEFRPDVIVLDIGLPVLNGYEACRRIREQLWAKDVVLIASTGWGGTDDRRQSQEAGFDHHLVKPVDVKAVTKILTDLQAAKVNSKLS